MKQKKLAAITSISAAALLLAGCVQRTSTGKPYGFVYDTLAKPTQHILENLAAMFGGTAAGLGWSIIIITFIVRLILMPVMIRQAKGATEMQERMAHVQPQLKALQERQKNAKTPEERTAASQAMMSFYRDNNISMTGGIGCLPLLIQMPIFAALYAAIQYSPELSTSYFLGINLGKSNIILVALTVLIYFAQGFISLHGVPDAQKKTMQSMMFMTPIMLGFMTLISPAGLGLYFFVGGIFACVQTYIINLMRPRIRKQIKAELKNKPTPTVVASKPTTPKTASTTSTTAQQMHQENQKRNAGKQNRRQ